MAGGEPRVNSTDEFNRWLEHAVTHSNSVGSAAFGGNLTESLTPLFQATATYGLSSTKFETFTSGTGTATSTNEEFQCTTGATVFSYGVARSRRPIIYRAGEGVRFRFTTRYVTGPVDSSLQFVGAFNVTDAFAIGYLDVSGTSTFGLIRQHHGACEIRELQITGAGNGTVDVTVDDVTTSSINVTSGTVQHNAFEIAEGLNADSNQANWYFTQNNDKVVAVSSSAGAKDGTYSITGSASGTWSTVAGGADKTTDFVAQSDWDNACSWLDHSGGNVWQISVPYLGYGDPKLFLYNPHSKQYQLVHTYTYANENTQPLFAAPSFRLGITSASLGSTTNCDVRAASFYGGMEGQSADDIPAEAGTVSVTGIGTTAQSAWQGRCRRSFGAKIFAGEVLPKTLTFTTDSTKPMSIQVYKNITTSQETNWQYVDEANSIVEVDETQINLAQYSGGRLIAADSTISGVKAVIDLESLGIYLGAGESITVFLNVSSGTNQECTISANWLEDY